MYGGWAYGQGWYAEGPLINRPAVIAVLDLSASMDGVIAMQASVVRRAEMVATGMVSADMSAFSDEALPANGSTRRVLDLNGSVG